jgi:hypothetical protein
MRLELYDMLCALVARLEQAGVKCCGSFAYSEFGVVVDFWRDDGRVGSVPVPLPLAVMPSVFVRRIEAAR